MQTIQTIIESARCRRGKAAGTSKRGAYWLACEPIKIRRFGGNGIGNGGADITHFLELRHYRSGEVAAVMHQAVWHQNGCRPDTYQHCPSLLDCTTSEQVIVMLKGARIGSNDWSEAAYSDHHEDLLTSALAALGLPASEPAPDELPTE